MDFLDPQKQKRHTIIMMAGYVLIGIAILVGTTVLLYQAYGFGVGKNGQVIQSGLLFFSSQPNPAQIYLNGTLNKAQTNSRVVVPAGEYIAKLTRSGYRDWQRSISVQGGDVQHFDYPFLFPKTLVTGKIASYTSAPGLATQSTDQRWLLVQQPGSFTSFDLYDLKNPTQAATTITLPANLLSKATSSQSWQLVQWADDDQHVLLQHNYDGTSEFILVDRQNPDQSLNLDKTLDVTPTAVTLNNVKYDQYYLYNSTTDELDTASLKTPTPTLYLQHVLAYKSYGNNMMLYATADSAPSCTVRCVAPSCTVRCVAPAGKVDIDLLDGSKTYLIRQVSADTSYVLDMASYSGTPYVVLGAASENRVYIYKDPIGQLGSQPTATAIRVLRVNNPTYVSFSDNAQFVVAESGSQFGVYDIEYNDGYDYTGPTLDAPQVNASWMDGDRLTYVSGGKLVVFDYDKANLQTLMAANPTYLPFFAPDFHYVYALAPAASGGEVDLNQTALLTPSDL